MTRYFLATHDQDTNKSMGMGTYDGEVHLELLCSDGLVRPGYEVPLALVQNAFKSRRKGAPLEFTAFKQELDTPKVLSANEALGLKPTGRLAPAVGLMVAGLQKVLSGRTA